MYKYLSKIFKTMHTRFYVDDILKNFNFLFSVPINKKKKKNIINTINHHSWEETVFLKAP